MAKFHLIPIVLGAAIGVGVYVVSKYLSQDEESEQIVDDSAFDDSEASESTEDADETEENADEDTPAEEPAAEPARTRNSPHRLRSLLPRWKNPRRKMTALPFPSRTVAMCRM